MSCIKDSTFSDLDEYQEKDLEFEKPVTIHLQKWRIDEPPCFWFEEREVVHWKGFKSKDLEIINEREDQKGLIALIDGNINGDLLIKGWGGQVRELLIHNCSVSGEIKIIDLEADKVEISGSAENVVLENVVAGKTNIFVEVEDSILLTNISNPLDDIEITSSAEVMKLKNVEFFKLDMKKSDFKKIRGKKVKADHLWVSYKDMVFENLTTDHFEFVKKKKSKEVREGKLYGSLVNSYLRL